MGINESHHSSLYISIYEFIISISKIMLYLALYFFLCALVYIYEAWTKSVWLKVINLEKGILYLYMLNKDLKYTETVNYEKGKKKFMLDCRTSGICLVLFTKWMTKYLSSTFPMSSQYLPLSFSVKSPENSFSIQLVQKRALSVWN